MQAARGCEVEGKGVVVAWLPLSNDKLVHVRKAPFIIWMRGCVEVRRSSLVKNCFTFRDCTGGVKRGRWYREHDIHDFGRKAGEYGRSHCTGL